MRRMNNHSFRELPAGILLLDSSIQPLCGNSEAIRILTYPDEPGKVPSLARYLAQKSQILYGGKQRPGSSAAKEFLSGRRHYQCQVLSLEYGKKNPSDPMIAIVLERAPEPALQLSKIAQHFHLTQREQQAVEFLVEGLSSKEIAERMGISPNTVKAFLRLVMIKMGVSSRAGIVGKILISAGNPYVDSRSSGR